MKLSPCPKRERASSGIISLRLAVLVTSVFCLLAVISVFASQPSWWRNRGAVNSSATPNDYSAANEGQLKQFTVQATREMNAHLPGGAGAILSGLVNGWVLEYGTAGYSGTNPKPSDFQAMTAGQFKYVGNLVWTQLKAGGYASTLPSWLVSTSSDAQAVNLGQMKTVFNFDLTGTNAAQDANHDGIPDWWENYYFGTTDINVDSPSPADDGQDILQEYQMGYDPFDYYHGQLPELTKHGGDNQTATPGQFAPRPLVVQVTGTAGNALANAPITFSVATGSGSVALSSTTSVASSVTVKTDTNGIARAYFEEPSTSGSTQITATAATGVTTATNTARTTVQITFTEFSGTVPVPGLALWLKADAGITFSSGSSVQTWQDQSGNGNDASQSNGGSQPQLVSTATNSFFNGRPAVHFNNQYLTIPRPVISGTGPFTWVYVAEWNDTSATGAAYQFLMGEGTGGNNGISVGGFEFGGTEQLETTWDSGGGMVMGPPVMVGQPVLGVSTFDGQNHRMFINGVYQGSAGMGSSNFYGGDTQIGGDIFLQYAHVDIAEIMVFNRVLTDNQVNSLNQYLAGKYAIPSLLTNLKVVPISSTQAVLSWQGRAAQVQIARETGTSGPFSIVGTVSGSVDSYIDQNLTPGGVYTYELIPEYSNTGSAPVTVTMPESRAFSI
jgi:hypothetical protein